MSIATDVWTGLADHQLAFVQSVWRNFEVERSRALADASADIIVAAVARAEPSSKIARTGNGHATQVGADTQHNKPVDQEGKRGSKDTQASSG